MRFVALDVETANPDLSGICQIGLVFFEDGAPSDRWSVLFFSVITGSRLAFIPVPRPSIFPCQKVAFKLQFLYD